MNFSSVRSFLIFFQSCIHLSSTFDISHCKRSQLWSFQYLLLKCWIFELFVFEHKYDRDVTENLNDLDTKIIIICLWVSFCSDRILLNVECEIVIWFDSIHDSCMYIMSISFFKSYFRHDMSRDVTTHNTEDCESRVLMIEWSQR